MNCLPTLRWRVELNKLAFIGKRKRMNELVCLERQAVPRGSQETNRLSDRGESGREWKAKNKQESEEKAVPARPERHRRKGRRREPQRQAKTHDTTRYQQIGSPEAMAGMASTEPGAQSRVMFQTADKAEEPPSRKLGKLTVKYNRKDLRRRLDIEEWIDGQLHLLFDCEIRTLTHRGGWCLCDSAMDQHPIQGSYPCLTPICPLG
ncbi:Protein phosphatase 1 regulatory subunit 14B [Merluccius polli]|uniref:Protein phosphatase 1 regulatory subunit 14B n=1 Tax=Merluccius polli TaxID=89951 RepID=A0AA47NP59_MERPO|nr:Protein phosphatase 1 regulatory subunit 14B [Merluccius polli]